MKENKYNDPVFFESYSSMTRSREGLEGAGEWHVFETMMPPLAGKKVLDLGCGFGWHCQYAASKGASQVHGIDNFREDDSACPADERLSAGQLRSFTTGGVRLPAGSLRRGYMFARLPLY